MQAKSTCKFGAHDKRLACLGFEEYTGEAYDQCPEKFAGERCSLRGAELEQGENGHFQNCKHKENSPIKKSSMSRERERSNHLIRSYGCKVVDVHFLGRKVA